MTDQKQPWKPPAGWKNVTKEHLGKTIVIVGAEAMRPKPKPAPKEEETTE